jgi:hypothetical protein
VRCFALSLAQLFLEVSVHPFLNPVWNIGSRGDRGYVGHFFSFGCHFNKTKNYEKIKV